MDVLRYYSFSHYLRRRFGCRVQKITLHAGFSCPNRDGTAGVGGCTFCNNTGFSPNTRVEPASIRRQLEDGIAVARRASKARKFIAYFQAYSNTHAPLAHLASLYEEVWPVEGVVGLSIGTRPDCVDAAKLDLIAGYVPRGEVWLEYGLQSTHDATLAAVNRCHTYADFVRAVEMTAGRGIRICVHTILGLPGETREMMLETHERLAELPIDGIKVHLLHVMKNTVLAGQYSRGEIRLLQRSEYAELVCDVLERLPARVVIQRMHADAPADVLVAPQWCLDKPGVLAEINAALARRDTWQGRLRGEPLGGPPDHSPAAPEVARDPAVSINK